MTANEYVNIATGRFSSSVWPDNLNVMQFLWKYNFVEYFLKLLENSCHFFTRDALWKLIEVFKADRHIFCDEIGSLFKLFYCFYSHIIQIFSFFASQPPYLF